MRIMTKLQYDAICDIVTEQKKRIAELEDTIELQKNLISRLEDQIKEPIVITDIQRYANPADVKNVSFGE